MQIERKHKKDARISVISQNNVTRTNPAYYYELAKTVSKAMTCPGQENPVVILTAFTCESNVVECAEHKGV